MKLQTGRLKNLDPDSVSVFRCLSWIRIRVKRIRIGNAALLCHFLVRMFMLCSCSGGQYNKAVEMYAAAKNYHKEP